MNKEIPNCYNCKWIIIDMNGAPFCGAQGYDLTGFVYNNRLCKKLYEKKGVTNGQ